MMVVNGGLGWEMVDCPTESQVEDGLVESDRLSLAFVHALELFGCDDCLLVWLAKHGIEYDKILS